MNTARTEDVKRLYENYPYPYGSSMTDPDFLLAYMFRGYFLLDPLEGWRILDVGCGTGHKLIGLAVTYPQASFLGLELSAASVAVAQHLKEQHRLSNLEVRQGDILEVVLEERYDVVQAFGVIHHLEDPQRGLNNLSRVLKEDGILSIWLYHPLGELERLTQRELLLTLWGGDWRDMVAGQRLMEQLRFNLDPTHYGPRYGPRNQREAEALEANADAFMHPIVHAYRFAEAMAMLRRAGMAWAAPDFLNVQAAVKMMNLGQVDDPYTGKFCIVVEDLLPPDLHERYRELPKAEQLKIIELVLRPRGFQILAGKGDGFRKVAPRMRGNVITL